METHNKRVAPVPASHKSTVARGRVLTRATTTKPPEAPKKREGTTATAANRMNRGSFETRDLTQKKAHSNDSNLNDPNCSAFCLLTIICLPI